jgi:undecaprenyl-diphosphatase
MDVSIIDLIKTVILGIVEGLTEWLPISSTGHMILVDEFIKLNVTTQFKDMFLVVIQLGAIMAVVVLNFDRLNPFSSLKSRQEKHDTVVLWEKVIVASIPAAVIGLMLNKFMEEHLMTPAVVATTLIFYGILFIVIENYNKHRQPVVTDLRQLSFKRAFIIGMFQVLSLVPGTSRSGSTIIGGLIIGVSRYVATEFTFFMAIPVMFGASGLKMVKFGWHYSGAEILILVLGMVTAFVVSILSIKFLLNYIKTNDFKAFGWYRIVLGIIVFLYMFTIGFTPQG